MNLNPKKSLGPYGFTSGFFKTVWGGMVGAELVDSVQHFFATGFLSRAVNVTTLALVQKKHGDFMISDFGPKHDVIQSTNWFLRS